MLLSAALGLLSVLHYPALLVGWWQLSAASLRVLLGPDRAADLHNRAVAWVAQAFQDQGKKALGNIKDSLFQNMHDMKSLNPERQHRALDILEIGVGSGANLEFYPPGSTLTCVDPNPHFREYFRRACAERASHLHADVGFVVGEGEHLEAVEDASVDAVVVTLVLCSVRDVTRVVNEAHRVLRPVLGGCANFERCCSTAQGGRLFYLEHVAQAEGTVQRFVQDVLTNCGLWPSILGCYLNRDPTEAVRVAGFRSVQQQYQLVFSELRPWSLYHVANSILSGVATK